MVPLVHATCCLVPRAVAAVGGCGGALDGIHQFKRCGGGHIVAPSRPMLFKPPPTLAPQPLTHDTPTTPNQQSGSCTEECGAECRLSVAKLLGPCHPCPQVPLLLPRVNQSLFPCVPRSATLPARSRTCAPSCWPTSGRTCAACWRDRPCRPASGPSCSRGCMGWGGANCPSSLPGLLGCVTQER